LIKLVAQNHNVGYADVVWRNNLSKINNKEKQIIVRKTLYDLSTELDEEEF